MMLKSVICSLFPVLVLVTGDQAGEQLMEYRRTSERNESIMTSFGTPIDNPTAILTLGRNGPLLFQDDKLLDSLAHFSRERIPERTVHAKGAGAFGYFSVTHDITKYTKASIFSRVGKTTQLCVRFSTVIGEKGSPDTVREPRGLAIKFYTEEGNYDLLTLSTPIFFVRDPGLYTSLVHAQKKNPVTNLKDPNSFWDFMTLRPENIHQLMFVMSDLGIPDGYRHMNAFSGSAFQFVNKNNETFLVKFHFRTNLGSRFLTSSVALNLTATDPDYHTRDLYNAIARGQFPSWTLNIQVMTQEESAKFRWDPLDVTKIWPENEFPLIPVGKMVLSRNPTNFFADMEQVGFSPSHLIPGIEATLDRTLQARFFIYSDTQRHRLGTNFEQLPVNYPIGIQKLVSNYERDGAQTFYNKKGAPNYYPNSFGGPEKVPRAAISAFRATGQAARIDNGDEDNFSQPAMLWRDMPSDERTRMIDNIVGDLKGAAKFLQERTVGVFKHVNTELADRIQWGLERAGNN